MDDRINLLLKKDKVIANCFQAVLYVHKITEEFRNFKDVEFLTLMDKNFDIIDPRKEKIIKGDVICITYNRMSKCQHAFIYFEELNNDHLIFQKNSPHIEHKYEITDMFTAIFSYSSKTACRWKNSKDLSIINLRKFDNGIYIYRLRDLNSINSNIEKINQIRSDELNDLKASYSNNIELEIKSNNNELDELNKEIIRLDKEIIRLKNKLNDLN